MEWQQLTRVTPDILCRPGWCLDYVRRVFSAPAVGATATAGWELTKYPHKDNKFPGGVAVPVWFAMKGEPAGHVAVRMPDGSFYSSSHPTSTTPVHHPNLDHLLNYYGGRLTLRGWSEDIGGKQVAKEVSVAVKPTTAELTNIGNWVYRTGLHRGAENTAVAKAMGKRFVDDKGELTPSSVNEGLKWLQGTPEWKEQDAKIKAPAVPAPEPTDADKKLEQIKSIVNS